MIVPHDTEASVVPSGENDTSLPAYPWRIAIRSCVATSHSMTVPSEAPEARRAPVGRKRQRTKRTNPMLTRMPFEGGNQVWGDLHKHERCSGLIPLQINDLEDKRMRNHIGKARHRA